MEVEWIHLELETRACDRELERAMEAGERGEYFLRSGELRRLSKKSLVGPSVQSHFKRRNDDAKDMDIEIDV